MSERWARTFLSAYRLAGARRLSADRAPMSPGAPPGARKTAAAAASATASPAGARPTGPLIWIHAASVGETIAVVPLIESILDYGINVVLTTGTVTSAQGRRRAARRPHHPPICAARPQAGGQPFPRPLAAGSRHHRRIGDLADDHPRARRAPGAAGAGQRPPVRPLLRLLEEARLHRRGAVREPRPCGCADRMSTASASRRSARGR